MLLVRLNLYDPNDISGRARGLYAYSAVPVNNGNNLGFEDPEYELDEQVATAHASTLARVVGLDISRFSP